MSLVQVFRELARTHKLITKIHYEIPHNIPVGVKETRVKAVNTWTFIQMHLKRRNLDLLLGEIPQ